MNRSATTKDELFLVKLYELSVEKDNMELEVDRYKIGRLIGQNDKGIDTIVKHLCQANFVKKADEKSVYLTPNGIKLVEHLLSKK